MNTTPSKETVDERLQAELLATIQLANKARVDLATAAPILIEAIRQDSFQSAKIERILWSCWRDSQQVNLCEDLTGLGSQLTKAALAMIAATAYLGSEADEQLVRIITESGSYPPHKL